MKMSNLNPIFFEKTKDGERVYDVSSRLIKDRVIFVDTEIDQEVASNITSLLFLLNHENEKREIQLWINSPGGSVQGLFAIYDMIYYRIKAPVHTICIGEACSAAAILLAAGTKGKRFCTPNAKVMIHQIQVDGIGGSNAEVEINTKELKKVQERLTEILARHTSHTKAKIKRDTKMDRWMSAEEAKAYGIIDFIFPSTRNVPDLLKSEPIKTEKTESKTEKPSEDSEEGDDEE